MAKAKFCLVVDTEADFWLQVPSPHFSRIELFKWTANKLLRNVRFARNREGIVNIVKLLKEYKFPATFTIVGHLYLKACRGYPHFNERLPEAKWMKSLIRKSWSYWDPKSNFKQHPGLYLGDFIEKEMKESYFDLGLHAFSHEALTLESEEIVESCVKAAAKAANTIGIKPISFGAPFNMIEDIKEPEKVYTALKKNGIKITRFVGKEDGLKSNHNVAIKPQTKKFGLKIVHASHYFEGNSPPQLINKILREIDNSVGKNVVYCLCTHDFTHKDTRRLGAIVKKVLQLEKNGKIKIVNMRQLLE